jgi:hypothetical protein
LAWTSRLLVLVDGGDDMTQYCKVSTFCPVCQEITNHAITMHQCKLLKMEDRPKIQEIFPNMPKEQREMFLTGICPKCWDKVVKNNEK